MTGADATREVEEALVAHWSLFGRWSQGRLRDENGVLWFETPIKHLPYNGVIRTRIEEDADPVVAGVLESFGSRGVQFFWLIHPSARPGDLADRLAARGLRPVERLTGMSLELDGWHAEDPGPDVAYREVQSEAELEAFHELTTAYWELSDEDARLVRRFQHEWPPARSPGHRYLAYIDGRPVAKGYLSVAGPPGVAAIYAMMTRPEARGRGVASGMTTTLLRRAQELGRRRVVLHSSEMAVGVYRRAGFVETCPLMVYATAALWSHTP